MAVLGNDATIKREYSYYNVEVSSATRFIITFCILSFKIYIRYIWKSTKLFDMFKSSLEILDEMRPIRLNEHTNRIKMITPLIGAQVDICYAFGFDIPKGCAPVYISQRKYTRKRGRPSKRGVEWSF